MRLLVRRHNEQSKEQTFQIDTFEMTSIWNGKKSKLKVGLHCFIYVPIMKNEIQNTFQFSFFIISGWSQNVQVSHRYCEWPPPLDTCGKQMKNFNLHVLCRYYCNIYNVLGSDIIVKWSVNMFGELMKESLWDVWPALSQQMFIENICRLWYYSKQLKLLQQRL